MLTIEAGQGLADADSYATLADMVQMAEKFGHLLPDGDAAREALLRRAALHMNGMAWAGKPTKPGQSLAWPRQGVQRNGVSVAADAVPREIVQGQVMLALEVYKHEQAVAAQATAQGPIVREQVDSLAVQYAEPKQAPKAGKLMPVAADAMSAALFAAYLTHRGLYIPAVRA